MFQAVPGASPNSAAASARSPGYTAVAPAPRHCVGETFAIYEMAIHIYHAARRFRLRCARSGPLEMEARINLRTREDVLMSVERRG